MFSPRDKGNEVWIAACGTEWSNQLRSAGIIALPCAYGRTTLSARLRLVTMSSMLVVSPTCFLSSRP